MVKKQVISSTSSIIFAANKVSGYHYVGNLKTMIADMITQYKDADSIPLKVVWKFLVTTTGTTGSSVTPLVIKSRETPADTIAADNVYTEINDLVDTDLAADYSLELEDTHTFYNSFRDGSIYLTRFEIDFSKKAKTMLKMYNKGQTPLEDYFACLHFSCESAAKTFYVSISKISTWDIVPRRKSSSNQLTPS